MFNKYSQHGEDGILSELADRIGLMTGYFVEFGAWDGKKYSNCCYLYEKGWKGCFIEGDSKRFQDLISNFPDKKLLKLNVFIEESGKNSLDNVLKSHGVSQVDVLSIDIDSDDLAVWESVTYYSPRILIIEYNPTIPFDTRFINPKGKTHGNAALSIFEVSERKGYGLVEGTPTNLIFVRRRIIEDKGIPTKSLQAIKDQLEMNSIRFFFGYDGMLLQEKAKLSDNGIEEFFRVPWSHYLGLQPIPKALRGYRDRKDAIYFVRLVTSFAFAFLRSPMQFWKFLRYLKKTNLIKGG